MKNIVLLLMLVSASGCAITSTATKGPDGRPIYWVDGMTAGVAFSKASAKCPNGYTLIGEPHMMSFADYTITFQCN